MITFLTQSYTVFVVPLALTNFKNALMVQNRSHLLHESTTLLIKLFSSDVNKQRHKHSFLGDRCEINCNGLSLEGKRSVMETAAFH